MSLVDAQGNPVTPKLDQGQLINMMSGLRIRIDAANAQLVQLGLLVEYLYENLEQKGIEIPMEGFPEWAENRYKEIQAQAQEAMQSTEAEVEQIKKNLQDAVEEVGINLTETVEEAVAQETVEEVAAAAVAAAADTVQSEASTDTEDTPVDDTAADVTNNTETE